LRFGNPARANGVAMPIGQHGFGRDTVSDRILTRVAVLQISDALVPVIAGETAEIWPGDEAFVAMDFNLSLKNKGFVSDFVRLRSSPIDKKHGSAPSVLGQAAIALCCSGRSGLSRPSAGCHWTGYFCRWRRAFKKLRSRLHASLAHAPNADALAHGWQWHEPIRHLAL